MIGTLLERLFVAVGADLSGLTSELDSAANDVSSTTKKIGTDFTALGGKLQNVGDRMKGIGAGLTVGLTAPLALFGKAAFDAASDAGELQSAFNQTFGAMAADMNKWAEATGNALGRSTQEIQTGANAFGLYFNQAARTREEAAKLSKDFTVLAQDLSSFHNTGVDEALLALRSGLSGESEPLRQFGVFLNDAAVNAKALEMGLAPVNGKLSDQQKIMARAAIIMEATKNAQGDVMRTSSGTANQLRALNSQWEEMTVQLGQALLPVITPIIGAINSVLKSVTSLSPTMQAVVVGIAAAAAAIGPLLVALGFMASGLGAILPLLGTAGVAGALGAVGAVAGPVIAVVAGLAAAWALFGDKVGPVLSELWTKAQEVLGPKLTALIDTVSTTLTSLWQGPLGTGIKAVVDVLGTLLAAFTSVFGEALIRILGAAIEYIRGTFEAIGNVIKVVVALLTGDWAGAWAAAKKLVVDAITAALNIINTLAPGATAAMKALYDGVKTWVQDRLGAVWDWLKGKLEAVGKWFFDLYDAVVGHSYIPDMVDGIGENMRRLQELMVDPAKKATDSTKAAFRGLAGDVSGILDRLFPLQAQLRSVLDDIAKLDKAKAAGQLDAATYNAARGKLDEQAAGIRREMAPPITFEVPELIATTAINLEELANVLGPLPRIMSDAEVAFRDFGEGLGNEIMGGLRDVLTGRRSIKEVLADGIFRALDNAMTKALSALEKAVFGEGGLGGFLGNIFGNVIKGLAVGGPAVPGKAYTVGSGELFVPGQAGRVLSRNDAMAAMGGRSGLGTLRVDVSGARGNAEIREMVNEGVQRGLAAYDRSVGDRVQTNLKRRA